MSATKKLSIDDGLVRLDINGNGLLCFNPSDFNLYNRFIDFTKELPEIEKKYRLEVETPAAPEEGAVLDLVGAELERARAIDLDVKARLSSVFGSGADFDQLLGGVNCMAFGGNGERVITNLLDALRPYIEQGLQKHVEGAAAKAKLNREQRRTLGIKK